MRTLWITTVLVALSMTVFVAQAPAQFDAPEVASPDARDLFDQGLRLAGDGDYEGAITEFEKALMITSNFPAAQYNLAFAYEKTGNLAKAEEEYKRTIELDPNHAKAHYGLGALMFKQGQYGGAITHLKKATEADPSALEAYYALGAAQHKSGDLSGARRSLEAAIEIDSTYVEAILELGDVEYEACGTSGNYDRAKATFRAFLRTAPNDSKAYLAYYQLAKIHYDQQDYEKAADLFGQAAAKKPGLAEAHYMRGASLAKTKTYDEAIKSLRKATALKDPYGVAHYQLARLYQTLGSFESALKEYRAAAADPGFAKRAQARRAAKQIEDYLAKLAEQQAQMEAEQEEEYDSVDDIPSSDFEP